MLSSRGLSWWRDRTLNYYVFRQFVLGFPFTIVGTYVLYQVQVTGYVIGKSRDGGPCVDYCLVPFGTTTMDFNSILLYVSALGNGAGGFCALFVTAYADYWAIETQLVVIFAALYGIVGIPSYWLRRSNKTDFSALIGLYVVFLILTYITTTLLNIYIPYCMKAIEREHSRSNVEMQEPISSDSIGLSDSRDGYATRTIPMKQDDQVVPFSSTILPPVKSGATASVAVPIETMEVEGSSEASSKPRNYGFKMSILGSASTAISSIITLIITIVLAQTLPSTTGQSAGLIVATVCSFLTFVGAIISYYGLPVVLAKQRPVSKKSLLLGLFSPLRELKGRWNMVAILMLYTIYNDALFAMGSVIVQLYFQEISPTTLEYSIFTLSGAIFSLITTLGFIVWQHWRPPFKLEYWLIFGYAAVLLVPLWGCIGFGKQTSFGLKNTWEFYVQVLIQYLSLSIASASFRVLFAEYVPPGSEIQWFGLQTVLSCATSWTSYVVTAPLQARTHQLRFPLVLSVIFLTIPVLVEIARNTMSVFKQDREKWRAMNK